MCFKGSLKLHDKGFILKNKEVLDKTFVGITPSPLKGCIPILIENLLSL